MPLRAAALTAACALLLARPAAAERPAAPPAAPVAAPADAAQAERSRARRFHLYLTLGVTAAFLASETLLKPALAPDDCRWCAPPGFDADVRDALVWASPERARLLSDLGAYAAAPLVALGFTTVPLLVSRASGDELLDAALPIVESVVLTQSLAQVVKFSVGRQRPFARFDGVPGGDPDDDNLSFFSGHSSFVFSAVTSAGVRAHQLGLRTAPLIWAVGLPVASATAYLRIAGDKHYLSDVVVGSVVGAALGAAVPLLLHPVARRGERRDGPGLSLVPTGRGAALTGTF